MWYRVIKETGTADFGTLREAEAYYDRTRARTLDALGWVDCIYSARHYGSKSVGKRLTIETLRDRRTFDALRFLPAD